MCVLLCQHELQKREKHCIITKARFFIPNSQIMLYSKYSKSKTKKTTKVLEILKGTCCNNTNHEQITTTHKNEGT